jgi:hypothetical protein
LGFRCRAHPQPDLQLPPPLSRIKSFGRGEEWIQQLFSKENLKGIVELVV